MAAADRHRDRAGAGAGARKALPPTRVDRLIDQAVWWAIYGGLLATGLGMAIWGQDDTWPVALVIAGLAIAALGFALIVVRARRGRGD